MFTLITVIISLISNSINEGLFVIYNLGVALPSLGVTVRRLHDTNRSGWLVLLELIPIIGLIIVMIFCAQKGTSGENKYGESPRTSFEKTAVQNSFKSDDQTSGNNQIKCKECGNLINADSEYCSYCGEKVIGNGKIKCIDCGTVIDEESKYCPECGMEI